MNSYRKRIVRVDVASNYQQVSDNDRVLLLCYIGQPGENGTGPHRLKVVAYRDAKKAALRNIGMVAKHVNVREYVLGDYVVIDSYTLAETDLARHACVGCWYDPETDKTWSIYRESGRQS